MSKKIDYFLLKKQQKKFIRNEDGTFSPENVGTTYFSYTEESLLKDSNLIPVYKNCECKFCTDTHPKIIRISAVLSGERLKDFESLSDDLIHAQDDLNFANCKLDGSWDGWEWIIEEKKKRNLK